MYYNYYEANYSLLLTRETVLFDDYILEHKDKKEKENSIMSLLEYVFFPSFLKSFLVFSLWLKQNGKLFYTNVIGDEYIAEHIPTESVASVF